jgi:hypothetical protein
MAMIWGLLIVIISDGILLLRVSAERGGAPLQTQQLTERELPMTSRGPEDSSVSLRLAWRSSFVAARFGRPGPERDTTFEGDKLRELGFRCGTPDSNSPNYRPPLPRLAYIVLERSEPAAVAGPDRPVPGANPMAPPPDSAFPVSSLAVVDASSTYAELRAKYPDPWKSLIVRGVVGVFPQFDKTSAAYRWVGRVSELLPGEIHVPLPDSAVLNRLGADKSSPMRYTVTLHYGPSLQPWVGSVRARM